MSSKKSKNKEKLNRKRNSRRKSLSDKNSNLFKRKKPLDEEKEVKNSSKNKLSDLGEELLNKYGSCFENRNEDKLPNWVVNQAVSDLMMFEFSEEMIKNDLEDLVNSLKEDKKRAAIFWWVQKLLEDKKLTNNLGVHSAIHFGEKILEKSDGDSVDDHLEKLINASKNLLFY